MRLDLDALEKMLVGKSENEDFRISVGDARRWVADHRQDREGLVKLMAQLRSIARLAKQAQDSIYVDVYDSEKCLKKVLELAEEK